MTHFNRLNLASLSAEGYNGMSAVETYLHGALDLKLLSLVKLRASQINGCAFCLDMHAHEARADGEAQQRLDILPAWRETNLFDERERAALAWTEALTRIADTHAPDEAYEALRAEFSEAECVNLTLAIGLINSWNRLAIGFRKMPTA